MAVDVKERKFARSFDTYDANHDGYIERVDLESIADRICTAATAPGDSKKAQKFRAESVKLWVVLQRSLDADSDQRISRSEFIAAFEHDVVVRQALRMGEAMFHLMDSDDDGRVDLPEWLRVDEQAGISRTDSERSFRQLDLDNDGYVTRREFMVAVEDFYRSQDTSAPGNLIFGEI